MAALKIGRFLTFGCCLLFISYVCGKVSESIVLVYCRGFLQVKPLKQGKSGNLDWMDQSTIQIATLTRNPYRDFTTVLFFSSGFASQATIKFDKPTPHPNWVIILILHRVRIYTRSTPQKRSCWDEVSAHPGPWGPFGVSWAPCVLLESLNGWTCATKFWVMS